MVTINKWKYRKNVSPQPKWIKVKHVKSANLSITATTLFASFSSTSFLSYHKRNEQNVSLDANYIERVRLLFCSQLAMHFSVKTAKFSSPDNARERTFFVKLTKQNDLIWFIFFVWRSCFASWRNARFVMALSSCLLAAEPQQWKARIIGWRQERNWKKLKEKNWVIPARLAVLVQEDFKSFGLLL